LRGVGCAALGGWCVVLQAAAMTAGSRPSRTTGSKTARVTRRAELSRWELAERGRETLEAIPEESRTKADYTAAMDGFRAVYHESPRDIHAASAVYAVAELLAEQGRTLHDAKSLKAAVGQYEFLRGQYPGSSLRVMALLAEAQIEANDLGDVAAAKERYTVFLKQYPKSGHVEEARAGLDALKQGVGGRVQGVDGRVAASRAATAAGSDVTAAGPGASGRSSLGAMPVTGSPIPSNAATTATTATATTAAATKADAERRGVAAPVDAELDGMTAAASMPTNTVKASARRRGGLAQVMGIRHWSTPTYTRVAIDLGDDVTFEAARVPNPDRIYFDFHGTRLAQELVGKSFAVTDDGFLKKIRAAQFSNDMTRVVLDVNDVTDYSAFLLPNPYRLIIDIHGGKGQGVGNRVEGVASAAVPVNGAGVTPAEVPAPQAAAVVKSTPGRPVPNTVSSKSASTTEIAALSGEPGKVEATSVATSREQGVGDRVQGVESRVVVGGSAADAVSGEASSTATSTSAVAAKKGRKGKADASVGPARAAVPTADGQTSLVRALGLKIGRIVIDAGHGGHDSGTIGVDGIEEKDVVLDVALRVGKLLHDRLGAEVVYTRSDDTFIPLETRTAIANKAQADLFLSIHANSSSDASARGVETYYLNFTSSPDALETAARENAVSDQSIHQLSDLVKKIALKDKISESREFASDVEQSLYGGLQRGNAGLKDRGVKKAPFVVLIGANMPSILAEISFVTNPKDANQLQQPEYRQRVAESLYKGVAKYAGGLSGAKGSTERASANEK
jgi:N-acetylmuramoyl-L-alanine amidase